MGEKKNVYSEEVKRRVIEMKLSKKYTNKQIMKKFGIRSVSQIKRWMKWFRDGEEHRLSQPIGKQYSFGKGPEELNEVDQLKRQIRHLEIQNEILKKVPGNRKELVPEIVIELVESLKEVYTVSMICDCIRVPRSTYYRWAQKSWEPTELEQLIIDICKSLHYRVGHRMVKKLLKEEHNISVNRLTAQRIMQKYKIQCRVKPKRKSNIAGESKCVVPNLLEQNFKADRPNQKWVTDITYLPFGESMMYLSTIMDLYNNEIVAYRVSHNQEEELVLETLKAACNGRETKGLILHSDQGAQYTSYAFQELAEEKGIITSMSRKGNCFDNAVIESFHSTIKSEEFYTHQKMRLTNSIVLEKVELYMYYYNYIRPFSKLNCLSPVQFRAKAA
ncbi:IS3 family transposase [Gracilibacillus salitolerans]|uniref:IS3 family transposase n=1 Tax=Gracilibacillus salitolerans TaxID=2663022 RepID=A0A5Q2TQN0_9BACI|nr:IS3 family transposase [Gracilibacillus salitolerans]QGH35188.1 IS3 family transposase [Gracilibacillus salitolerans]